MCLELAHPDHVGDPDQRGVVGPGTNSENTFSSAEPYLGLFRIVAV